MKHLIVLISFLIPVCCFGQRSMYGEELGNDHMPERIHTDLISFVLYPDELQDSFKKLYPTVKYSQWYFEDSCYVATFKDNTQTWVYFYGNGTVVKTEVLLPDSSALPQGTLDYAKSKYKDWKRMGTYFKQICTNGEVTYIMNLQKNNEYCELEFNSIGEFIKLTNLPAPAKWGDPGTDWPILAW